MTDVKRVQYFDHQFLRVDEFTDEQDYHRRMRRVHNANLHTPGIASGLDVTVDQGASHVRVSPGTALDANGQDIVLDAEYLLELGGLPPGQDAYVVISWRERSTDPATDGSGHDTRWTETPNVEGMTSAPTDGVHLVLARVARQGTTVQPDPDLSGRRAAGVTAGDLALSTLRLRAGNVVPSAWPTFSSPGANAARLDGALSVTGALTVSGAIGGAGPLTAPSARLDGALVVDNANGNGGAGNPGITLGNASGEGIASTRAANAPNRFGLDLYTNAQPRLSIDNAGRVGIGVRAPQVALDVQGGEVRWANNSRLSADQGGSLELGGIQGVAGTGTPFIDFHFAGLNQDFNARIINDADGRLTVQAANVRHLANVQIGDVPQVTRNFMVQGSEVHSGGGAAGYSFANRDNNGPFLDAGTGGARWVLYSAGGIARLWSTVDRMLVSSRAGEIGVRGMHPTDGLPSGWGGGVHTFDVYAEATVAAGPAGGPAKAWINSAGQVAGITKPFIIDHPSDPQRDLVHATLEGPEHAVIYRGEATLSDGTATIELPAYFEALTRNDGRSVQVTPQAGASGRVAVLGASGVQRGSFRVRAADPADAKAKFWWQVIAVRADVDVLEPEPVKTGSRKAAAPAPPRRRTARKPAAKTAATKKAATKR
jgi:hypothetical protein